MTMARKGILLAEGTIGQNLDTEYPCDILFDHDPPDMTRAFLVTLSDRVPVSVFVDALRVVVLGIDPL